MQGLDLGKLDKLPNDKDKIYGKDYPAMSGALLRPMYNAGLYRLLKGVPDALWSEVVVMKATPNPKNSLETGVVLGYQGKPIMELTARQKADKSYSIIYIHYLVSPRALAKVVAQPAK
jgi:hypothetical protein